MAHQPLQQDDIFTVYPAHLRRLMEENHLTVPEICAALGMPSLQEWYAIQKHQEQPVRLSRVVQTARIYLRHPDRLPVSRPSIRQFYQRSIALTGSDDRAKRLMEAILHKQWGAIEKWLQVGAGNQGIDVSISRLIDLMMKMDDEEFLFTLSGGALSFYVQVNASPVHTFVSEDGRLLYATAHQPDAHKDVLDILDIAPVPGRRLKGEDFVVPSGDGATYADVISQMGENHDQSQEDKDMANALDGDKESLAWHQN